MAATAPAARRSRDAQGAQRSPGELDRIFAIIDSLAAGEFDRPEQTLRTGDRVRSWPSPPVRIYYQRHPDVLWIMRIYDQRRRPVAR